MDMIVSYASYDTLLAMRVTNRYFRDSVGMVLLDHAIARHWDWDNDAGYFLGNSEIFLTKREFRRLPDVRFNDCALNSIRVLDLHNAVQERLTYGIELCWFEELHPQWLRTRGSTFFKLDICDATATVHVHFLHDPLSTRYPTDVIETHLPGEVTKVVINVEPDCIDLADNPGRHLHIVGEAAPQLKDLVFINKPHSIGTTIGTTSRRCIAAHRPGHKIQGTLVKLFVSVTTQYWNVAACKVTLVGFPLECLSPELFGSNLPGTQQQMDGFLGDFKEMLYESYVAYVAAHPRPRAVSVVVVEQCIERIEIIDHETYRCRVGEEAYRLETVW